MNESNFAILKSLVTEKQQSERNMMFRHPWVNLFYNWLVAIVCVLLIIALVSYGLDVRTQRRAENMTAIARASWEAEQAQAETLRLAQIAEQEASEEYSLEKMSDALAKVLYGAEKFREKYHYSEDDFITLCRCVTNRVENPKYSDDIYNVISQPEQWVGYFDSNPVLKEYKKIAYDYLKEWLHETVKPISNDFVFAEFTANGIFLKQDLHADGYARRWRAS